MMANLANERDCEKMPERVRVWGLPLMRLTMRETVERIDGLIHAGRPGYVITPNLNYAMLTDADPRLDAVNAGATVCVADGMPLVWASRLVGRRLPERVTGADLIWELSALAAAKDYPIFILGGAPGVADRAAENLVARFPGLRIAGTESPPFRDWTPDESAALIARVRESGARLLFTAFSMPRGELWLAENHQRLGVPVSVQCGAAVDFAAGRVSRCPRFLRRAGLEWAYRLAGEPRRLAGRYFRNGLFMIRATFGFTRSARTAPDA